MADNVELPPGGGGAIAATDDVGGAHYQRVKLVHWSNGVIEQDVYRAAPYPVDPLSLTDPKYTAASSVALAAGGSVDLDSDQITAGRTGRLCGVVPSASVHCKCVLKLVTNGVATASVATWFFTPAGLSSFTPPSKNFFSVAHAATAGFDGFRVTITNMDIDQSADVYVTFMYDEN